MKQTKLEIVGKVILIIVMKDDNIGVFGDRYNDGKTLEICSFNGQYQTYNTVKFIDGDVIFEKRDKEVHVEKGIEELLIYRPHVLLNLEQDTVLKLVKGAGRYTKNICIRFNNTKEFSALSVLINKGDIVGEIGVKFGATVKYLLDNHEEINTYYCFEIDPMFCDFLERNIKDRRLRILSGDASESLLKIPDMLDVVYFDASHIYDVDKKILDSLMTRLKPGSKLVFDDYNIQDIKKLVDEFVGQRPGCDVYYSDNKYNRLIRLYKHG